MKDLFSEADLEKLFWPKRIAVIGASRTPGKVGYSLVENLVTNNFEGEVYPVNPKAEKIFDLQCYESIAQVPHQVDLGIIALPAPLVKDVVEETGKAGTDYLIIIASGFSEIGDNKQEKEIVDIAHRYGMRILGPNIFGVYYAPAKMNATFGPTKIFPGKIALISQSGALGIALIEKTVDEEIGLSCIASVGNKADIGEVDFLRFLEKDDHTKTVIIYLEGTEEGRELLQAARSVTPKKPVVVIKAGKSEKGARAVASHTGSLAGSDKIYDAAFKQGGMLRATTAHQAFNWAQMLSSQPRPRGENVVIVTNGGGVGVMAADACQEQGLHLLDDQKLLSKVFKEVIPEFGSTKNPVDMTGMATPREYKKALAACFGQEKIDSVLLLYCMGAGHDPGQYSKAIQSAIEEQGMPKPTSVSMLGGSEAGKCRKKLNKLGIPAYEEPEEAVSALGALYRWKEYTQNMSPPPEKELAVDWEEIAKIVSFARRQKRKNLLESEAKKILKILGVQIPSYRLASSVAESVKAAEDIGYPVVMKVESKDIVHKTEAGGVKLNLGNSSQVKNAYQTIISSARKKYPQAQIEGVSVNKMVKGGLEVIVGATRDPSFGPTVMFGLGGIYVEILEDVSFRVAPLDRGAIRKMIGEIKAYPLMLGVRGEKGKDIQAVVETIYRVGRLVDKLPDIVELDINPLMVLDKPKGCRVLDCSISITQEKS